VILAPILWRLRTLAISAAVAILISIPVFSGGLMEKKYGLVPGGSRLFVEIQVVFWAAGGIGILATALADTLRRRDARSCLLVFWIGGTFLFAAFFNWTVNGRSILPMAPAVGILLARQLEKKVWPDKKMFWPGRVWIGFALSGALALLVARADFLLAAAVKKSAQQVAAGYKYSSNHTEHWFQGHWGFQYYLQAGGGMPVDFKKSAIKSGDDLAIPANNTNLLPLDPKKSEPLATVTAPAAHWLSTMNSSTGAGFYASVWGALPFAFDRVPPEKVLIYKLK
jgi:hypothetical protein